MKRIIRQFSMVCVIGILTPLLLFARTSSPKDANIYIISPAHGEVVQNPVTIKFGLSNMGIAPIGVNKPNSGHFHLLIDEEKLPDFDKPLHFGEHYLHFSEGQTQVTLELSPGAHSLQLILGDLGHMVHEPPVLSRKIQIIVRNFSPANE